MDFNKWIKGPRILDGGVGTALCDLGLDLERETPHSWNLKHVASVEKVHRDFIAAGAEAIHTNSFGALLTKDPYAMGKAAAEIATGTAKEEALVIGSIGPTGDLSKELPTQVSSLAKGLIDGGVDCLHVETLHEPKETELLLSTILDLTSVPVFASVACRVGTQPETILGQPLSEFLELLPKGLAAVGVNCGITALEMAKVLPVVCSMGIPVITQPTPAPDGKRQDSPAAFARDARALLTAGASLVGGCCGTTSKDIQALSFAARQ